jgi:hypothetical protein
MSLSASSEKNKDTDSFASDAVGHLDALYAVACKLTRNPT